MSACGCGGAKCRLAAGDERHGTVTGHANHGCRCASCCEARQEYDARRHAENARKGLAPGDPRHGTSGGYTNFKCRCEPCREAGQERGARYRSENAEKVREKNARYYAKNAEKVREYQARWRAENAEKVRESEARYRSENAEKVREQRARWRAENPEKVQEYTSRYRDANPEKVRESEARYRATPEGRATSRAGSQRRRERARNRYCGCDTRENLHAVWVMDEGRCAYCGDEGTDYEHVVPLARGGWGCISNFRISCKSCNSRKHTKPLSVFLAQLAASGVDIRPGATNSGLPCPAAAARMAARMLPAGSV